MSAPAGAKALKRPLTDRARRVALILVSSALAAAALALADNTPGAPSASDSPAPRAQILAPAARSRALHLQQARAVGKQFLRGYLSVIYGHARASAVPDAAPGILAALTRHKSVPPALTRLHPRIVAINAAQTTDADTVTITANVSDGEVLTYPIRLLITDSPAGGLLVTRVGEG